MAKTTTTRETKAPLFLLLTEERANGYYHLYGRVVTQRYEQNHYQPDGPGDEYGDGPLYSGLRLRCQGDQDSRQRALAGERDAPVYGFTCEYQDVYHVDLRRARRMTKTLTTLDAKLSKLRDARGYPHTYGQYVGRVAEALGCTGIGYVRTDKSRAMTGERWNWVAIGDGVSWVERAIDAWVDEARPKPAPAAAGDDVVAGQEVA